MPHRAAAAALIARAGALVGAGLVNHGEPGEASQRVQLRGCDQRIEARPVAADGQRDVVIGPLRLARLRAGFRPEAQDAPGAPRVMPIKALAALRDGRGGRLQVPRRMRLFYVGDNAYAGGPRQLAVTLAACRRMRSRREPRRECRHRPYRACRGRVAQFAGEIAPGYDGARQHGRCAELIVGVAGRRTPLRQRLFAQPGSACPRAAEGS